MVTQYTNSNRAALICSSAAAVLIQDRSSPCRCFKSVKSRNGLTKLREGQSRKSGQQRHVVLTRGDVLSSSPSSPERGTLAKIRKLTNELSQNYEAGNPRIADCACWLADFWRVQYEVESNDGEQLR